MDQQAILEALESAVPFNKHVGVRFHDVGEGTGAAELATVPEITNHVGTMHAGALFLVGEAAGGAAFVGGFLPHMASLRFVAKGADISYRRSAKGTVTATGAIRGEPGELIETIRADGRAEVLADIELRDESSELVAEMTVRYHAKWLAETEEGATAAPPAEATRAAAAG